MMRALYIVCSLAMVFAVPALADDCVDVELGAEVLGGDPLPILSLFFSVENCGTESGLATFDIDLSKDSQDIGSATLHLFLPAGREFSRELELPIPPAVPAGTYELCVTVTLGTASDVACAAVTLNDAGQVVAFFLLEPLPVEHTSWGAVKEKYR